MSVRCGGVVLFTRQDLAQPLHFPSVVRQFELSTKGALQEHVIVALPWLTLSWHVGWKASCLHACILPSRVGTCTEATALAHCLRWWPLREEAMQLDICIEWATVFTPRHVLYMFLFCAGPQHVRHDCEEQLLERLAWRFWSTVLCIGSVLRGGKHE